MKGQILDYSIQANTGTISGNDGKRYTFGGEEWKSEGTPTLGRVVDFEASGDQAKGVYSTLRQSGAETKDKTAAGLLALFLGWLGIHKFYLGFTGAGLVFLLTNTIGWLVTWIFLGVPNAVLGIIAFIEGIIYLTKSNEEFEQVYVIQKKAWF